MSNNPSNPVRDEHRDKVITAYDPHSFITAFDQSGSGQEHAMEPLAEHTKLEQWNSDGTPYLKEYSGSGKLQDKRAIVTGGDSGIGRSVAIFFAREGADVTIVYLPEEQKDAEAVKAEVEKAGKQCLLIATDLKEPKNCEDVIKKHIAKFGRIDVLVNNASMQKQCSDLKDIDPGQIMQTFQTNIVSMHVLTKYALAHMKRGSAIINSGSVTAYKGSKGMLDYSSTKGAISSFTRSLALQLLPQGIKVNCVAPGPVYTPLQPASRSADQMEAWGIDDIPLRGRVAQPAELGGSYVFLAGPDSNFVTGTVLHINGGQWFGN